LKAGDVVLREAKLSDVLFVADMDTAIRPDDPRDPVSLDDAWRNPEESTKIERFIGEIDGVPVGYAHQSHDDWARTPKRYGRVTADLLPSHRTPARLDALFAAMEERSRADGTRTFTAWSWEDDALRVGALTKRGYVEERRDRFWELDLVSNRGRLEAMAAESREKMRQEKIRLLTIDRDADPEKWKKLWQMSEEAIYDVPTTVPYTGTSFTDFMKWMRSPGLHEDRIWIARDGEAVIGVSILAYPPKRGVVSTDWTGVARAGRGRGVARAAKCETVMQAIALGVDRIRTDNDSQNAPILHINETMGYKRRADGIEFMRPA
jgi:RimJ/RimL family protein N-acetyltransferase